MTKSHINNIGFYGIYVYSKENDLRKINTVSQITVKIVGTGKQYILKNGFSPLPSKLYINGNEVNPINTFIDNLSENENYITMKWDNDLTNCNSMFFDDSNITEIDLSQFVTSSVTNMAYMFCGQKKITSMNLDNFDTSKVEFMNSMFQDCEKLTSLDLSNFNTSLVKNFQFMFNHCYSLIYLNVNNFITSKVTSMRAMFQGCGSLESLDISNFNTSSVVNFGYMFNGCSKLTSLNVNNFITSKATSMNTMFQNCNSLESLDISNFDTSSVENFEYMFFGCRKLISLDFRNFNINPAANINKIFNSCNNKLIVCYEGTIDETIKNELKKFTNNCLCFQNSYKFFHDKNECIDDCSKDDKYLFEYNNVCYESCPTGTCSSPTNEFLCEYNNGLFDNEYHRISNFFEFLNNNNEFHNNITKDNMESNIRNEIKNGNLDELIEKALIKEEGNLITELNNQKYEITTTNNNDENTNISIIKLGECENKLKKHYNISEEESLIIFKIDVYDEGLLIPKVEYEIYDMKTKRLLDLKVCEDLKIELLLPCNIDENNIFKYNSSSEYYNDICYPYTTEDGTDIVLSDRKNEFADNNMSLCEKDCEYSGYDSNTKKAICKCDIKLSAISDIEINKDELLNNFININEIINLKIIKCYKQLFTLEGLKKI